GELLAGEIEGLHALGVEDVDLGVADVHADRLVDAGGDELGVVQLALASDADDAGRGRDEVTVIVEVVLDAGRAGQGRVLHRDRSGTGRRRSGGRGGNGSGGRGGRGSG